MNFKSAIQRAAILVKSLPQRQASKLLSQLDAEDLQAVFKEIRTLGAISSDQKKLAFEKFLHSSASQKGGTKPSPNRPAEAHGSTTAPFAFMAEIADTLRFRLLENEHPKNVAMVLSHLPTPAASAVLNRFEPENRIAILQRLCDVESNDANAIASLSFQLKSQLNRLLNSDRYRQSGLGVASKLLSCTDVSTQDALIDCLKQQDPELAVELQQNVIRFDDLQNFSNRDVKTVLKWVDTSLWAPALKQAHQKTRNIVLRNMSDQPREILNREIQNIRQLDAQTANQAQSHIINVVWQLKERDKLTSGRPASQRPGDQPLAPPRPTAVS